MSHHRDQKPPASSFPRKSAEVSDIKKIRQQIDAVDKELLFLLNRRMQLALAIGHHKKTHALPVRDERRERALFERLSTLNPGPLSAEDVQRIYETIMTVSRRLQTALSDSP
jgi:chorismate mutase